jgi:hypothetical protein
MKTFEAFERSEPVGSGGFHPGRIDLLPIGSNTMTFEDIGPVPLVNLYYESKFRNNSEVVRPSEGRHAKAFERSEPGGSGGFPPRKVRFTPYSE